MESNKVTVKIFGQEYTIMGAKSREHIIRVADYVDVKMNEVSQALSAGPLSSVAVLSAVNIADDYFTQLERYEQLEASSQKAAKDAEHYVQLWDEAKKSHLIQKEEMKEIDSKLEEQRGKYQEEINRLKAALEEKEQEIQKMKDESAQIEGQIMASSGDMVNELEAKYKDLESTFFDIQMENIQLKGEIDRYKKKMEQ